MLFPPPRLPAPCSKEKSGRRQALGVGEEGTCRGSQVAWTLPLAPPYGPSALPVTPYYLLPSPTCALPCPHMPPHCHLSSSSSLGYRAACSGPNPRPGQCCQHYAAIDLGWGRRNHVPWAWVGLEPSQSLRISGREVGTWSEVMGEVCGGWDRVGVDGLQLWFWPQARAGAAAATYSPAILCSNPTQRSFFPHVKCKHGTFNSFCVQMSLPNSSFVAAIYLQLKDRVKLSKLIALHLEMLLCPRSRILYSVLIMPSNAAILKTRKGLISGHFNMADLF